MTVTPALTDAQLHYLLTETVFSVVVTIALSCAFAWGVFGRSLPLPSSDSALQVDGALQALIVAFMGALVPTVLTRRRRRAGSVDGRAAAHRWPAHPALRALTIALIVGVPAALLHLMIVPRLGIEFNLAELLLFKALFGMQWR